MCRLSIQSSPTAALHTSSGLGTQSGSIDSTGITKPNTGTENASKELRKDSVPVAVSKELKLTDSGSMSDLKEIKKETPRTRNTSKDTRKPKREKEAKKKSSKVWNKNFNEGRSVLLPPPAAKSAKQKRNHKPNKVETKTPKVHK